MASSTASHPVIFSTSTQHILPPSKYLIPGTWARFQLSQLVNKTLELTQPVPFDFLVRGQILRGTIAEWCTANDVKEEETLEIEYFESLMPPKLLASIEGEEWVGSVSCQRKGYILSGSYDSSIRIYDHSQKLVQAIQGHTGPITSVCWLGSQSTVVSGSHDGTARITLLPDMEIEGPIPSIESSASLRLHTAPISSVASNTSGTHILTAGWDSLLGLFSSSIPDEHEVLDEEEVATRKKRRRVESHKSEPKRKAPIHVLKSHTGKITRGIFNKSGSRVYSCSVDSTIRSWDVNLGVCTDTITANNRPMTDLTVLENETTLLASSSDRVVAIYDIREKSNTGPPSVLPHPAFPSSLASHPTSSHKVASGAYDGIVRMWDLRSTKAPLNSFEVAERKGPNGSITKSSKKVLSVDWANGLLVVGGETGINIWRVTENGEIARS
ncbi:WD40 repeat-like protein [Serendipita vermifera]|nr:WD40 repeat-like protein [Serendipita vermifera]